MKPGTRHSRADGNPSSVSGNFKKRGFFTIRALNVCELNDRGKPQEMKQFYIYIMASQCNGTLYTGVTSNLVRRVWEHKEGLVEGFTKRYGVRKLVYFEAHETAESAITREKQIEKWERAWKIRLIHKENPEWEDLYDLIIS
jgi:putative endonuclease